MSNSDNKLDRRRFLVTSSAAVATACMAGSAGSLLQSCAGSSSLPPGPQDTGLRVADVPVGTYRQPQGADFILGRDEQGFFAFSNLCTHNGCSLPAPTSADGTISCPCHGARFDAKGNNLTGPRGQGRLADLEHYVVTFQGTGESARIVVDTSMVQSDRNARVPAPDATPSTGT